VALPVTQSLVDWLGGRNQRQGQVPECTGILESVHDSQDLVEPVLPLRPDAVGHWHYSARAGRACPERPGSARPCPGHRLWYGHQRHLPSKEWLPGGGDGPRLAAIRRARRKARKGGVSVAFYVGEAIKLGTSAGPPIGGSFDLAVDIGCLHAIQSGDRVAYGSMLRRVLQVGGYYLLYAWGPRKLLGRAVGLAPHETESLLAGDFERRWIRAGEEQGSSSYWYLFKRR